MNETIADPHRRSGLRGRVVGLLSRFVRETRGAISPMLVIALVPIIGALGMAVEGSNWWMTQHALQNAADTAAMAAAINGSSTCSGTCGSSTYTGACATAANDGDFDCEAIAAAARAGYVNGANSVTVFPQRLTTGCPGSASTCYQVVIQKDLPLYLLQVVGFKGSNPTAANKVQTIAALSIAQSGGGATPFCIVALGSAAKKNLTINGGPKSSMPGCAIASNGATDCNGQPISGTTASYGASGDTNTCADNGNNQTIKSAITDPYSGLTSSVPPNTCKTYSQEPVKKKDPPLATANQLSGTISTSQVVCGDALLTGNVTLGAGVTLTVVDGQLDLAGNTITGTSTNATTGASGATIIFTGNTNSTLPSGFTPNPQFFTGSGTVSVNAPTSGTWSGMAVYQDSNSANLGASSTTIKYAGNTPTLQLNGLLYAPNMSLEIAGAIGSTTACIGFLVNTFTIDGTGSVIDSTNCSPITLTGYGATKVALVK